MRNIIFWVSFLISATVTQATSAPLVLTEVERFVARLPMSLEYSAGTCTLWTSGNSHIVSRVTLYGKRVETRYGNRGVSFVTFHEGKLLGVEYDGKILELKRGETLPWGRIETGNNSRNGLIHVFGTNITGGDIRPDGAFIISSDSQAELHLFESRGKPVVVTRMPRRGTFRGVAFDPTVRRTYALFRSEGTDFLVVLGPQFELVTTQRLESWGQLAEGIAVQPETGDVFISFLQDRSINGEIVRFSIQGLDTDKAMSSRPLFVCATS